MIRPPLLLLAVIFASCGTSEPPPGEVIGTFRFVATLDATTEEGRCSFDGAPPQLGFEGILSHDPSLEKLWLSTGSVRREGELDGAHFTTRTPAAGPGISRRLSGCTCPLEMVEIIEGSLVAAADCKGEPASLEAPEQEASRLSGSRGFEGSARASDGSIPAAAPVCPEVLPDGKLSWSDCSRVCGSVREEVEFPAEAPSEAGGPPAACSCTVDGLEQPAPQRCAIVYHLEGTLM